MELEQSSLKIVKNNLTMNNLIGLSRLNTATKSFVFNSLVCQTVYWRANIEHGSSML